MTNVYSWKSGRSLPLDPQVIGEAISGLENPSASGILAAATPEDAPLHPAFEWDDSEAANQYRLSQARALPRRLNIEVTPATGSGEVRTIDAFVHVPNETNGNLQGNYVSLVGLSEIEIERAKRPLLRQIAAIRSTLRSIDSVANDKHTIAQIGEHLDRAEELAGALT